MSYQIFVDDGNVLNAENIINYQFADKLQLRQALHLADSVHQDGNKRLAQLGDAVISVILIKEGLRRGATREQINNVKNKKESNVYVAAQGSSLGLADCIYNNPWRRNTIPTKPMATTVEAIIGAVFNDSGENIAAAEGVMEALGISWPE